MKVQITEQSKKEISAAQVALAKRIVAMEKDDGLSAKDYAEIAVRFLADDWCEVITADARISKTYAVWNAIDNESEDLDVSVHFIARGCNAFYEGEMQLSDIWKIGTEDEREKCGMRRRSYCFKYTRED